MSLASAVHAATLASRNNRSLYIIWYLTAINSKAASLTAIEFGMYSVTPTDANRLRLASIRVFCQNLQKEKNYAAYVYLDVCT